MEEDEDQQEDPDSEPEREVKWDALELIAGYKHSSLLAVEARLGHGSDDWDLNYASVYYRPSLSLSALEIYGLLGYSSLNLTIDGYYEEADDEFYEEEKESFSGVSYGAGVTIPVRKNLVFNLEYRVLMRDTQAATEDSYKAVFTFKGIGANLLYRF
jgi:opacity protein-like surface antigen